MKKAILLVLLALTAPATFSADTPPPANNTSKPAPANTLPADADKAWQEIENASKAPARPAEWGGKAPTQEQNEQFQKYLGERSAQVAAKAHEFYTRFPDHPKADEAKQKEQRFLQQAVAYGNTSVMEEAQKHMTDEQKLEQKMNAVQKRAMSKRAEGMPAVLKEMEAGMRELMKEYPKSQELWGMLLQIAQYSDKPNQKRLLTDIVDSKAAGEEITGRAKGMLKLVSAVGRPLEISFTAVDGRKIDLQKMKGTVVMVDFWASWCGPCMAALPEVLDIYAKYHGKGFEIVGISLDKTRKPFDAVIEQNNITWPQYFDGMGWGNKFALEYGVGAIPSVWLVDKTGILRTTEGREDLEKQIKDLLAEKI